MKLQEIDRDICYIEDAILQALIEVESGNFEHYKPHDKPYIIAFLVNHRRQCSTCQGVALTEQLFKGAVKVV